MCLFAKKLSISAMLYFFFGLSLLSLPVLATSANEIVENDLSFSWKINGKNLDVILKAKTEGWIGLAFQPSKRMKDANFMIAMIKGNKAIIEDHFGTSEKSHKLITSLGGKDAITNKKGKREKGETIFSFSIPLKAADKFHKNLDTDKDITVLLAYSDKTNLARKHSFHAAYKVNLSTGVYSKKPHH